MNLKLAKTQENTFVSLCGRICLKVANIYTCHISKEPKVQCGWNISPEDVNMVLRLYNVRRQEKGRPNSTF